MYLASPLTVAASAVAGYIVEYEPSAERKLGETKG
jgi:homoaconitase/3-isopropylmalate dehydratase large subunit